MKWPPLVGVAIFIVTHWKPFFRKLYSDILGCPNQQAESLILKMRSQNGRIKKEDANVLFLYE